MISDLDIYRSANVVLKTHGHEDAPGDPSGDLFNWMGALARSDTTLNSELLKIAARNPE